MFDYAKRINSRHPLYNVVLAVTMNWVVYQQKKCTPHISGRWKSKIQVWTEPGRGEDRLLVHTCCLTAVSSCVGRERQLLSTSYYKGRILIHEGSHLHDLMPSQRPHHVIPSTWGLGVNNIWILGGHSVCGTPPCHPIKAGSDRPGDALEMQTNSIQSHAWPRTWNSHVLSRHLYQGSAHMLPFSHFVDHQTCRFCL